jgi:putative transposase
MKCRASPYRRHRFPPEIIQHAVWLYYRFNLSHRDIEDILARRGVLVSQESIRLWRNKFGPHYAEQLRRGHRGYGDTVFMDEVSVRIGGRHRAAADHYRELRRGAFASWDGAVAL